MEHAWNIGERPEHQEWKTHFGNLSRLSSISEGISSANKTVPAGFGVFYPYAIYAIRRDDTLFASEPSLSG